MELVPELDDLLCGVGLLLGMAYLVTPMPAPMAAVICSSLQTKCVHGRKLQRRFSSSTASLSSFAGVLETFVFVVPGGGGRSLG